MQGRVSDSALIVESPHLHPQPRCSDAQILLIEPVGSGKDGGAGFGLPVDRVAGECAGHSLNQRPIGDHFVGLTNMVKSLGGAGLQRLHAVAEFDNAGVVSAVPNKPLNPRPLPRCCSVFSH